MKTELTGKQILGLLRLMLQKGPQKLKDIRPELDKSDKDVLSSAGLVFLEKKNRASWATATDKAWDWLSDNLDLKVPIKSPAAGAVLAELLRRLKHFSDKTGTPIAALLAPGDEESVDYASVILSALRRLSGGKVGDLVRLADLRKAMADMPRYELDKKLLKMQKAGHLILEPQDDRLAITKEDEEAAIDIYGDKRHLVILKE